MTEAGEPFLEDRERVQDAKQRRPDVGVGHVLGPGPQPFRKVSCERFLETQVIILQLDFR